MDGRYVKYSCCTLFEDQSLANHIHPIKQFYKTIEGIKRMNAAHGGRH